MLGCVYECHDEYIFLKKVINEHVSIVFDDFDDYTVKYGIWKTEQTHKRKAGRWPVNGKLHVYT